MLNMCNSYFQVMDILFKPLSLQDISHIGHHNIPPYYFVLVSCGNFTIYQKDIFKFIIIINSCQLQILFFTNKMMIYIIIINDKRLTCSQWTHGLREKKSFKQVWQCHQLLSRLLVNGHFPQVSHKSHLSANDKDGKK